MTNEGYIPTWEWQWINDAKALSGVVSELLEEDFLGVDTETSGWQIGQEKLCLIQLGLPKAKRIYLIDVLAVDDLSALSDVLGNAVPQKIAHNAQFEERQFARHGLPFKGVIDTLQLSRTLRPDLPNHTLKTCCKVLLNLSLSKVEQVSDWSQRPLTDAQIQYAAADAEVAVKLYQVLAALEEKLRVDGSLTVPQLMELIFITAKERFQLTKNISADLAFLNARYGLIQDLIREKLAAGEAPYEGPFGEASISQVKKNEISVEKVKEKFPEIASLVIVPSVERKQLLAAMKEYGINAKRIDEVLVPIGQTPRLKLSLSDIEE